MKHAVLIDHQAEMRNLQWCDRHCDLRGEPVAPVWQNQRKPSIAG
jgi:hypothetical protein